MDLFDGRFLLSTGAEGAHVEGNLHAAVFMVLEPRLIAGLSAGEETKRHHYEDECDGS